MYPDPAAIVPLLAVLFAVTLSRFYHIRRGIESESPRTVRTAQRVLPTYRMLYVLLSVAVVGTFLYMLLFYMILEPGAQINQLALVAICFLLALHFTIHQRIDDSDLATESLTENQP